MRRYFRFNLLTLSFAMLLTCAFASCEEDVLKPTTPPVTAEPNTVTGTAVDAQGKPLAGVKVRAENPLGNNMHVEGTTDVNGKYKLKITSIGGWKIYAWKEVQFMDKTYHLRLGMKNDVDYDAFSTDDKSITKDFVWKLNGRIPDRPASANFSSGYFGGMLYFVNLNGKGYAPMATGTKVTVTLTPVQGATYLDGSPATTPIVKSFTITQGNSNYYLGDIKVANYRMNIEGELNGVKKVVYMGPNTSLGDFWPWLDFYFDPYGLSSGSYESGIKTGIDTPFYLACP